MHRINAQPKAAQHAHVAQPPAIARVVDTVFSDPSHYLLGVGPLRVVADTIIKGLPG